MFPSPSPALHVSVDHESPQAVQVDRPYQFALKTAATRIAG